LPSVVGSGDVFTPPELPALGTVLFCSCNEDDLSLRKGDDGRTLFTGNIFKVLVTRGEPAGLKANDRYASAPISFERLHAQVSRLILSQFGPNGPYPQLWAPRQNAGGNLCHVPLLPRLGVSYSGEIGDGNAAVSSVKKQKPEQTSARRPPDATSRQNAPAFHLPTGLQRPVHIEPPRGEQLPPPVLESPRGEQLTPLSRSEENFTKSHVTEAPNRSTVPNVELSFDLEIRNLSLVVMNCGEILPGESTRPIHEAIERFDPENVFKAVTPFAF
jgi:hypothetical protein